MLTFDLVSRAESADNDTLPCNHAHAITREFTLQDANLVAKLFRDFALPSLAPIIITKPTKRHAAMRLLYAFAAPTPPGHLQVRKQMVDPALC